MPVLGSGHDKEIWPSPAIPEADELLNTDPLARLVGMLLDQHMH